MSFKKQKKHAHAHTHTHMENTLINFLVTVEPVTRTAISELEKCVTDIDSLALGGQYFQALINSNGYFPYHDQHLTLHTVL